MAWHDNLKPVSEDEAFAMFLTGLGYDRAKLAGLLRQYMRMLNASGSGGYTQAHMNEAAITDSIRFSAKWQRAHMDYLASKQKAPD